MTHIILAIRQQLYTNLLDLCMFVTIFLTR